MWMEYNKNLFNDIKKSFDSKYIVDITYSEIMLLTSGLFEGCTSYLHNSLMTSVAVSILTLDGSEFDSR